ncbi:O-antigen ligase family protein [Persephonella sp.]
MGYILFLFSYGFLSIINGYELNNILQAFIKYFGFMMPIFITYILAKNKTISAFHFYKYFKLGVLFYIITKFIVVVMLFYDDEFLHFFKKMFPLIATPYAGGIFPRIGTSTEILVIFLFSVLWIENLIFYKKNKKTFIFKKLSNAIYIILLLISILLSFNRYIWVYTLFIMLIYAIFIIPQSKMDNILKWLSFSFLSLFLILVILREFAFIFYDRLLGEGYRSIEIKIEQAEFLLKNISESPLWGFGLGSYSREYIRNNIIPFEYEVQWLSILHQFGFIGLGFSMLFVLILIYSIFKLRFRFGIKVYLLSSLILVLLSGLTNPYLITSAGSLIFSFYIILLYGDKNIYTRHKGYP